MSGPEALQCVIRKLEKLSDLSDEDKEALAALPIRLSHRPSGSHLIREGHRSDHCYALLEGFAYRSKSTRDGRTQILSFHVPGDLLDLRLLLIEEADHSVVTLSKATVAEIRLTAMRPISQERANVARAFWRDTLIDAAIFREWEVNIGQRDAASRIAHMLAEFAARRSHADLPREYRFIVPMTQQHIAEATGLTSVHVNRSLKALEAMGAFSRQGGRVVIEDTARLEAIAGFDAAYLRPLHGSGG